MIDRHVLTATLADGHPLDIDEFTVKLADTWSPYVQGSVTCKLPPAPIVAVLDPRQATPPAIRVDLVRHFGDDRNSLAGWTEAAGSTPVSMADLTRIGPHSCGWSLAEHWNGVPVPSQHLPMVLTVDGLSTDARAGTLTLDIGGPELRLQDRVNPVDIQLEGASVTEWVNDVLTRCALAPLAVGDTSSILAPLWEAGQSAWDVIESTLTNFDLHLICDEAGRWRIISRTTTTPAAPVALGDVTELSRRLARQDWHDSVVVIWRWKDFDPILGPDTEFTFAEYSSSPTYTRTFVVERDAHYPGPWLANLLWERERRKGEQHTYQAPANLAVRPLQTVTITDGTGTRTATATSASFNYPACTVTVETREE